MNSFRLCIDCHDLVDAGVTPQLCDDDARCQVCGRLCRNMSFRVDGPTADRAHHALCDELATAAEGGK